MSLIKSALETITITYANSDSESECDEEFPVTEKNLETPKSNISVENNKLETAKEIPIITDQSENDKVVEVKSKAGVIIISDESESDKDDDKSGVGNQVNVIINEVEDENAGQDKSKSDKEENSIIDLGSDTEEEEIALPIPAKNLKIHTAKLLNYTKTSNESGPTKGTLKIKGDKRRKDSDDNYCHSKNGIRIESSLHEQIKRKKIDISKLVYEPGIYTKLIEYCTADAYGTNYALELYDPDVWLSPVNNELARVKAQSMAMKNKCEELKQKCDKIVLPTMASTSSSSIVSKWLSDCDSQGKRKSKWNK